MSADRIKDIIDRMFVDKTEEDLCIARGGDIDVVWSRVVPENIRAHSYIVKDMKKRLVVRVDSSCYLAEMKFREKDILKRLRDAGIKDIEKIDFII